MRQVIIHLAEEDEIGYWAEVPSLPGCISQGDTLEETLVNIQDAIEGYIYSLQKHNLPIPPETFA